MEVKKKFLLGFICLVLLSCGNEEDSAQPISSVTQELKIMDFASTENMQNKIDEIIKLKEEKERITSNNFITANKSSINKKDSKNNNEVLINKLKQYHLEVLNNIYQLRKQINFISIKSVADEINSLKLINPEKANELEERYKEFLIEDNHLTTTIYDDRIANVVNLQGMVLINGEVKKIDKLSKNITGKYLRDEAINSGVAASLGDLTVYYAAGREVHENDLGVKFFRYYTQLYAITKLIINPILPPVFAPVPVTYNVNPGSIAGFVQTGSAPFSDYAFSYDYISGFGPSIRNTGGKMNTPYKPAGGKLSATFSLTIDGVEKTMVCDFKYLEK